MSQQPPKKSGSRDINELKARLGLKKGAAAPGTGGAAGAGPGRPNSPTGGVMPPPGLAVPPPPGAAAPGPVVPNAADDPFGAMNAMAQMGAAQRAPEIVIVHDGKPVESVSSGTRAATLGKYALIALVPFILGIAIRGISKDANAYNEGINGAKALLADVKTVKGKMAGVKSKIENDDAIKKSGLRGKPLTDAIGNLHPDKLEVKQGQAISRKQNIGDTLALSVMEFYAEVATLQTMVKEHQARAKADDMLIAASRANSEKMVLPNNNPFQKMIPSRYGVLVWSPSEEEAKLDPSVGAKLVELGPPYCADGKQSTTGTCPESAPAETLGFRASPDEPWQRADFFTDRGSPVPSKKILLMMPGGVFQNFVIDCANGGGAEGEGCVKNVGGAASISLYEKRVENILKKLGEVIELGNALEAKLTPKARENPRFTFFM